MTNTESVFDVNSALLSAAQAAAKNHDISVSEQLSLWITLGQLVESKLTSFEISALINDTDELNLVVNTAGKGSVESGIDILALAMSHQNEDRISDLSSFIRTKSRGPVYEAVGGQPGLLRQINPDGSLAVGTFKKGKFTSADCA